ncbi:MAG TPA: DUF4388 domain-containing protein [Sandaracinaceae bacterium LLY-WYZ-13_1]|nr:DUF4388 domain-containing protein [Sandaracinaceae bacterium LLY-WYZ-13_1]
MGAERRTSPRIEASLEVQIVGVDRRAILRRGDIGLGGLFVETDVDPGEPGTIRGLRLRSRDKAIRVEVPGRVVRVCRSDDLLRGPVVTGVAFELVAYEPGKRDELAALVLHIARRRPSEPPVAGPERAPSEASVRGLHLETDWRLRKGERVRVEVPTPGGESLALEGRVARSRKSRRGTYRARIDLAATRAPRDRSIPGVRAALSERPGPRPSRPDAAPPHLAGDLAQLGLATVLSLAAMERMTGVLRVTRGPAEARLYLRDGDVVDAVDPADRERAPRALLGDLLRWNEGRFALGLGPVDRPRRLGVSTTALLLDLAREHDEARRVA